MSCVSLQKMVRVWVFRQQCSRGQRSQKAIVMYSSERDIKIYMESSKKMFFLFSYFVFGHDEIS